MTRAFDALVIGGGMAGASLAYFLAPHARVGIVEAEDFAGRHSTGRSAAFYDETYGGRGVQPLTTASKSFLFTPPGGFADAALVSPRGAMHVAGPDGARTLDALAAEFAGTGVAIEVLDAAAAEAAAPLLRPEWRRRALLEPDCKDIDVARLHQGFLAGSRRHGAVLVTGARIVALDRQGGLWRAATSAEVFEAPIVVNAAGAWADGIAAMAGIAPLGITPLRRTVVAADLGRPVEASLPLVIDAAGTFYFKPDAGSMWISPHDETPDIAGDVQPEEIDIAVAIDRFETATDTRVRRVVRAWAGLRSFAPDRLPVYGFARQAPGFFWCAGQGGFGIQTAPAAGSMAAALILGRNMETPGIDPGRYSPRRFD